MFSHEMFRLLAEEREREVRRMLRTRRLLPSRRDHQHPEQPARGPRARGR